MRKSQVDKIVKAVSERDAALKRGDGDAVRRAFATAQAAARNASDAERKAAGKRLGW